MNQGLQRGVSLVEALVALAVMAFGMMGLVGLQSSMRLNADISKQRGEAVRIAQEQIELWRSFDTLDEYRDAIVAIVDQNAVGPTNTNTTYRINASVTPGPTNPPTTPPVKAVVVRVTWTDRTDNVQTVVLTSRIAAADPSLSAALSVPANGTPSARSFGRHPSIPPTAVPQSNGTSRFVPPGLGSVGWVFNNTTGLIVRLCDVTFTVCETSNLLLLTGYVRWGLWSTQPLPTQAETLIPFLGGFPETIGVRANLSAPSGTVDCAIDQRLAFALYYCPMPLVPGTTTTPRSWSGQIELRGFNIASGVDDNAPDKYRVCRYTPEPNNAPAGGNFSNPLVYSVVTTPLFNQNYLIIRAGLGADSPPFTCPGDDDSTPYINGQTFDHQPPRL